MAANSFESLISHWDERLRREFLASVYNLRSAADVNRIAALLELGDVDGALRAVGLDPASFRPLDRAISQAYEAGGAATARTFPAVTGRDGYRIIVQFNIRNPGAEAWLRDHSSRLITDILDDQRAMIREHLRAGMQAGANPRTTALDLVGRINRATGRREGGVIGLTNSQAGWLRNYERELQSANPSDLSSALTRKLRDKRFDPAIRKALANDEAIPAATREAMVRAYKNRSLRYRAETISRSESLASLHAAQHEAITQAINSGAVSADAVSLIWRASKDDRTRHTHREMSGQQKAWGDVFISPSGATLRFPGDPMGPPEEIINCRCYLEQKIDFYRDLR